MSQSDLRARLFSPLDARRSSDRVADVIRRTIFDGRFRPGDRLPTERTLAQRFQVTRNTVREAMRQLEQLRMVSIRQGSGVVVRDILSSAGIDLLTVLLGSEATGSKLISDALELRAVVGRAIAALAISRIRGRALEDLRRAVEAFEREAGRRPAPDPAVLASLDFDLHTALVSGSGNVALVLLFNSLRAVTERVPHLLESLVSQPDRLAILYRKTLGALENDDRTAASKAFARVFEVGQPPRKRRRK
ncbi:MAG: FadR family transcriptional regulator [Deltaproteobacteria bacterium]|nr:FadR family transcriptional regulator [Deltaproteobacteria bacterium]